MDFGKKTYWRGDGSDTKKTLFASIESSEKVQEDTLLEQKHNANVLRDKWVILKFFCYNCHAPHYWGGKQVEVGVIDYQTFCPTITNSRSYQNVWLETKYMDVPEADAVAYSP